MCRLALELPTALQVHRNYAILFHRGGVFQFANLNSPMVYDDVLAPEPDDGPQRIWALIDTNQFLLEPADIFKQRGTFFVVNTTSPRSEHIEWLNKSNREYFYMKPWSLSEVLQAYVYLVSEGLQRSCFLQSPTHRSWALHRTSTVELIRPVWCIPQGVGSLCVRL
jgi:hypothetical protein